MNSFQIIESKNTFLFKNEMSARALSMEELEMVNGGTEVTYTGGKFEFSKCPLGKFLNKVPDAFRCVWYSITH